MIGWLSKNKEDDKKEVIVMLGLATGGKDYNAKRFIKQGYIKVAFADALREALWEFLEYKPKNTNEYIRFKNGEFKYQISPFSQHKISGRKMLQNFGSIFKKVTKNDKFWNCISINNIKDNNMQKVVITDCRFDYEVEGIMSLKNDGYNVKFYWCCCQKNDYTKILSDNHESEALSQFIYYRQNAFGLNGDFCEIPEKTMERILNHFKTFLLTKI